MQEFHQNLPNPTKVSPPPWNLKGNGYIFLFKFSKKFVEENAFLADYQRENFWGGFGTMMLVDYETSGVGAYRELLFVPGMFNFNKKKIFSISKIYVSTYDSVWNGIQNWGIPKELADFDITKIAENEEIIEVKIGAKTIFKVHLKKRKFYFPISTKFFPLKLAQRQGNDLLLTNSPANGKATFAQLLDVQVDSNYFPDISQVKPIAILAVKDFKMMFPLAEVLKGYF
jgi:hypothetical protein